MIRLSEVVRAGVDHNCAANDTLGSNQLDELVRHRSLSVALPISLEVSQVTNMAVGVRGRAVILVVWVKVRTGRSATIGVVTKCVHMHSTLSVGIVAGDVP